MVQQHITPFDSFHAQRTIHSIHHHSPRLLLRALALCLILCEVLICFGHYRSSVQCRIRSTKSVDDGTPQRTDTSEHEPRLIRKRCKNFLKNTELVKKKFRKYQRILKNNSTMMMVVNKENNSSDLNTGVKSVRNAVEKDVSVTDSNGSQVRGLSPRPTLSGFTLVTSNKTTQSPPLTNRINSSNNISPSTTSSTITSSPASSLCSPTFPVQSPPVNAAAETPGSPIGHSAFNLNSSVGPQAKATAEGAHLLSQHLLELNQMRPHGHQLFQDNTFYQSRQLLNGNDLSDFKLNVQLKEKREAFAMASEATSEEVVVDGNDDDDDATEDSQQNTVC